MLLKLFNILLMLFLGSVLLAISKDNEPLDLPGPSLNRFTPEQDSAYKKAIRNRLPSSALFKIDLNRLSSGDFISDLPKTPMEQLQVMSFPEEYYMPDPREQAHFQDNINRSLAVPFINTKPSFGAKVPLAVIGQLLGIVEDLSPNLKYTLDYTADVEIVIFSMQAIVVATIFKGTQPPGNYKLTWNGRDDNGRKMPKGDYVAEIRIGKFSIIRKRIYLN